VVLAEWNSERDLPKSMLTYRLQGPPDRPGIRFIIPMTPGSGMGWPDLLHPALPSESERPEWMKEALADSVASRQERRERVRQQAERDPDLRKPVRVPEWEEIPDPERPSQTMKRRARGLSVTLQQLADQTGLSILADYDPCWDDYYSWLDYHKPGRRMPRYLGDGLEKEKPLWEALEYVRDRFRVEWKKSGKFLVVRSRRVPYAEIDRIDLFDKRRPPPIRFPGVDDR
jgi:hypothetical protein